MTPLTLYPRLIFVPFNIDRSQANTNARIVWSSYVTWTSYSIFIVKLTFYLNDPRLTLDLIIEDLKLNMYESYGYFNVTWTIVF